MTWRVQACGIEPRDLGWRWTLRASHEGVTTTLRADASEGGRLWALQVDDRYTAADDPELWAAVEERIAWHLEHHLVEEGLRAARKGGAA